MHTIDVIDSHTGGEPTRTVIAGFPDLGAGTLMEQRERFRRDFDRWRAGIACEPRGSATVVGALLLPPQVLATLNSELNKTLEHPELKAAFAKIGVTPRGTTPEEATAFTNSEYEKWKKVIVDGKIKPE